MNINISRLLSKPVSTYIVSGVAGFTGGAAAAYISEIIRKRSIVVVPAEPVTFNPTLPDVNFTLDPELVALLEEEDRIQRQIAEADHLYITMESPEDVESSVNIFTVPDGDWDPEYEMEHRDPDGPYIIHADEYLNDEMDFKQETVTYYELDDIMATMADVPIYNWTGMMGDLRWGHGSKDKNVVYIRNEMMRKEWEVLRHHGSFEVEVQGLSIEGGELKHSLRKFRDD